MNDISKAYGKRFRERAVSPHNYPGEWAVRTLLGTYPELKAKKNLNENSKVLDLGFGDGRNWMLLKNMGLNIFGVDISNEIIESGYLQAKKFGIEVNLKVGCNSNVPYPDNYFDAVLASNSFYYVDKDKSFNSHLRELSRYTKNGGLFVASFPDISKTYIFKNAKPLGDGVYEITNDIHNLRNGYTLRGFNSKDELYDQFKNILENISLGYVYSDYFNYEMGIFIVAGNLSKS